MSHNQVVLLSSSYLRFFKDRLYPEGSVQWPGCLIMGFESRQTTRCLTFQVDVSTVVNEGLRWVRRVYGHLEGHQNESPASS